MFLWFLFSSGVVSGLSFYIYEGDPKCFVLDQPAKTVVLGKFDLLEVPPEDAPNQGVLLKVTEPEGHLVYHQLIRGSGKFSFATNVHGKHRVCLVPSSGPWFSQIQKARFYLELDNSIGEIRHEHIASQDKVEHLTDIASTIVNRLGDIKKQQEYSREKEALFKDESETISTRLLYLTLFETFVILVSGLYQIFYLKQFLRNKNLIN